MSKISDWLDLESLTLESDPKIAPPPMYRVYVNNDDYTPMDFVVKILQLFFGMNEDKATQTMLEIHYRGRGTCGVFTQEVAETKVAQVNQFARKNEHPLLCTMEPEESE
ncbi:ATP-dependent Clp protease adapter ClpS [Alginatibacterium sediminis]|uniref:ATP-dependent Clp protease adapter protein ClpS n=1 Tax=Alginatibacterium sediminis TaxID=2164068 RepID=A0A420EGP8_9ALTE|nr:ATP-dependent Clp protease adapter ClpS [Alginatibacterium sediminis]RKF19847.1 ATP-dependent Clp protease adapter ClpS [Alginatibacterium sediminis]